MKYQMRRACMTVFVVALALSAAPLLLDLATPGVGEASDVALTTAMASVFPAAGQGVLIASAVGGGLFLCWLCERLLPSASAHRRRDGVLLTALAPGMALLLWVILALVFDPHFRVPAVLSGVHVLMAVCASLFAPHLVNHGADDIQAPQSAQSAQSAQIFGRNLS